MVKRQFMFIIMVGLPGLIFVPLAIGSLVTANYLWAVIWLSGLLAVYLAYLVFFEPETLEKVIHFPAGSRQQKLHDLIVLYVSLYVKVSTLALGLLTAVIIGGFVFFFLEIQGGRFTPFAGIALFLALACLGGGAAMLYLEFSINANNNDEKREQIAQRLTDFFLPGFDGSQGSGNSQDPRLQEEIPVNPDGSPPPAS